MILIFLVVGLLLFGLGFVAGYFVCNYQMSDMLIDVCHEQLKNMNEALEKTDEVFRRN